MRTDNELIEEFYVSQGGKPTSVKADIEFYSSSFDMLMPVVDKIESMGYYYHISRNTQDQRFYPMIVDRDCNTVVYTSSSETRFDAVYNSVVTFIKWYNDIM